MRQLFFIGLRKWARERVLTMRHAAVDDLLELLDFVEPPEEEVRALVGATARDREAHTAEATARGRLEEVLQRLDIAQRQIGELQQRIAEEAARNSRARPDRRGGGGGLGTRAPPHVRCWTCGGNHYQRNCDARGALRPPPRGASRARPHVVGGVGGYEGMEDADADWGRDPRRAAPRAEYAVPLPRECAAQP